ncbi:MAG: DUF2905 domain-containing protein [Gammaproteobacteria bacterium]
MSLGKFLIVTGGVTVLLGVVLVYAPWLLNWFGRLPGDIRIEDEHKFVFIPITSMIIASVLLSAVLYLISMLK